MAAVPVTLVGVTYAATGSPAGVPSTFVGVAYVTGLGVGGGPSPGGQPPGIWGGGGVGDYIDAGLPGQQPGGPVKPWGPINYPDQGLPGAPVKPWGPINYPDQGLPGNQPYPDQGLPGAQPPFPIPPNTGWRWVYSPFYGWVLDPGSGGKPRPPSGGGGGGQQPPPGYPDQSLPQPQPLPGQ